jgi:hypothetical protein
MACTNEMLEKFSVEHFTFINQFFGDQTVREVIAEVFPNARYQFKIEEMGKEFENSFHHVLIDITKKNKRVCSIEKGHQDLAVDKNDTLCQSYSLMKFLGAPIKKNKIQKQIDMVLMYDVLVRDKDFMKKLRDTIDIPNSAWIDYCKEGHPPIAMTEKTFLRKTREVLKKWKEYGYLYFIGDGTCPK